jgi:hypothetical protein
LNAKCLLSTCKSREHVDFARAPRKASVRPN